jgi:hypothetical protein
MSDTVIANPPQINWVYTSSGDSFYLFSQFSNEDAFICKWTTVRAPPSTTEFKRKTLFHHYSLILNEFKTSFYFTVCRDKMATSSASGNNIQPKTNDVSPKMCSFIIDIPVDYVTEIFGPVVNFTSPDSYLQVS